MCFSDGGEKQRRQSGFYDGYEQKEIESRVFRALHISFTPTASASGLDCKGRPKRVAEAHPGQIPLLPAGLPTPLPKNPRWDPEQMVTSPAIP
jgi:hypothetical protein